MNIIRLNADTYLVGAVHICRVPEGWAAVPYRVDDRPLFTVATLEDALDMAAGAIEMLRPVAA